MVMARFARHILATVAEQDQSETHGVVDEWAIESMEKSPVTGSRCWRKKEEISIHTFELDDRGKILVTDDMEEAWPM